MPVDVYHPDQPSYAGGATYCRVPLAVIDELTTNDIAVLGVPVDEAVGTRPGARFGPQAIRVADDGSGPADGRRHLDSGVHPFASLRVLDVGDLPVTAGDPASNLRLAEETVATIASRGAVPVVLGGDHSIARATIAGVTTGNGQPPYVVQFDAHTDTGAPAPGRTSWNHGTPMFRLVDEDILPGDQLLQVGLRGSWPGEKELAWARTSGVRWWTARDVRHAGIAAVLDQVLDVIPADAPVWVSFDIDAVDPAFAPGTGTPEPGGLTSWEALDTVYELAQRRRFAGFEVVEVSPPYDHAQVTAMLAHRLVFECLAGMATRTLGA